MLVCAVFDIQFALIIPLELWSVKGAVYETNEHTQIPARHLIL